MAIDNTLDIKYLNKISKYLKSVIKFVYNYNKTYSTRN